MQESRRMALGAVFIVVVGAFSLYQRMTDHRFQGNVQSNASYAMPQQTYVPSESQAANATQAENIAQAQAYHQEQDRKAQEDAAFWKAKEEKDLREANQWTKENPAPIFTSEQSGYNASSESGATSESTHDLLEKSQQESDAYAEHERKERQRENEESVRRDMDTLARDAEAARDRARNHY